MFLHSWNGVNQQSFVDHGGQIISDQGLLFPSIQDSCQFSGAQRAPATQVDNQGSQYFPSRLAARWWDAFLQFRRNTHYELVTILTQLVTM